MITPTRGLARREHETTRAARTLHALCTEAASGGANQHASIGIMATMRALIAWARARRSTECDETERHHHYEACTAGAGHEPPDTPGRCTHALAITDSANANPAHVARALVHACEGAERAGIDPDDDPAVQLMVAQLRSVLLDTTLQSTPTAHAGNAGGEGLVQPCHHCHTEMDNLRRVHMIERTRRDTSAAFDTIRLCSLACAQAVRQKWPATAGLDLVYIGVGDNAPPRSA